MHRVYCANDEQTGNQERRQSHDIAETADRPSTNRLNEEPIRRRRAKNSRRRARAKASVPRRHCHGRKEKDERQRRLADSTSQRLPRQPAEDDCGDGDAVPRPCRTWLRAWFSRESLHAALQ